MPRALPVAAFLLCLGAVPSAAANWADDTETYTSDMEASKAICRKLKSLSLPAPDPAARVAADCDAATLYYGLGRPADPAAARACALHRMATDKDAGSDPRSGPAILAMIYANGAGVTRDYDIAIAYACRIEAAPAETDGRVKRLAALRATGPAAEPFDLCQDATSGLMEGYCAEIGAAAADARREAAITALTRDFDPARKARFQRLRQLADAFVRAAADNEVDVSGTARGALIIGSEQLHKDQFLDMLRDVLSGRARGAEPL